MKNKDKQIIEAILNDRHYQYLMHKRVEIYSIATPKIILKKDGTVETIWLDETNHPVLPFLNEEIEHRKQQIINFYSR